MATELRGLLKPLDGYENSADGYMTMHRAKINNQLIHAAAARLGISL